MVLGQCKVMTGCDKHPTLMRDVDGGGGWGGGTRWELSVLSAQF